MKTFDIIRCAMHFDHLTNQNETTSYTNTTAFMRLRVLSHRLTRLDTELCNGEIKEEAYERAIKSTHKSIRKVLEPLHLDFYHQTDPRGCALYIAKRKLPGWDNYSNELAII